MSDATTPAENAPAATPATPDEQPNTPAVDGNASGTTAQPQTPDITPEIQALIDAEAAKASQTANREAQNLRKRLKEHEDAEQKRKDAELTELELAQKQRDEAANQLAAVKEQAQAATLRAEVATQAAKLNIVDADAALALMSRDGIEFNEAGAVTGVEEALTALVAAKPFLVAGPGTPQLDANNSGRQAPPTLTPQQQTEQLYAAKRPTDVWSLPRPA